MQNRKIKIVAIIGSVRPGNYTSKVLSLVVDEIKKQNISVEVIDPSKIPLLPPGTGTNEEIEKLQKTVSEATGVIFATPEYHGSFSSVTKLLIENLGFPSVLSGKTVTLVGVAAGQIGAIKSLEHLRSVCAHVGAIVLPSLVSVPEVYKIFDGEDNCIDEKAEKRIRGAATNLIHYIEGHICPKVTLEAMMRETAESV